MQLHDPDGKRLYLTAEERRAFLAAAGKAARPVRTLCGVLHTTGCRVSEALALTPERVDLTGKAVVFESLKKRRRGVYGPCRRHPGCWMSSTSCTACARPSGAARGTPIAPSGPRAG